MKKIIIIAFALLIVTVIIGITSGCATGQASVAELSKALMHCYTLQNSPYNLNAYKGFTVKDLEVIGKTNEIPGMTSWSVRAKLYDPYGQYVADIAGNLVKNSLGSWSCL